VGGPLEYTHSGCQDSVLLI